MANHALLFGICQFSRGLPPLPAASQDVQQLTAALKASHTSPFQVSAYGPALNHTELIHNLRRWTEARTAEDRALIYFSTHAIAANGQLYLAAANTRLVDRWDQLPYYLPNLDHNGQQMRAALGDSAMLPIWDTAAGEPHHPDSETTTTTEIPQNVAGRRVWDGLYLTAVPLDIVKDALDACQAAQQVVILDCCITSLDPADRAGGATGQDAVWVDLCEQLAGDRRFVLAASHSSAQYLPFQKAGELSVYTRYVVEGIRTGLPDINDNQRISIGELHQYVQERVHLHTPLVQPQQSGHQHPIYDRDWFDVTAAPSELSYRRFVQQLLMPGRLPNSIEQTTLRAKQTQWHLTTAIADRIEDEVQYPSLRRRDSQQRYRAAVEFALQQEHTLTETARSRLEILRQHLGLRAEDVSAIQQQAVTKHQQTIVRQQKIDDYRQQIHDVSVYAQVVQRSLQEGDSVSSNLRSTLDRIKTLFRLPNHRLDQLEAELMSPVEAEHHAYQARLQFYRQLFAEAVNLDVHRDADVRDRFNNLRHSLNLAAIDVGKLEQAVIQHRQQSEHHPVHDSPSSSENADPGIGLGSDVSPPTATTHHNGMAGQPLTTKTTDAARSPDHEFDYPNPIQHLSEAEFSSPVTQPSPAPFQSTPDQSTNSQATNSQATNSQATNSQATNSQVTSVQDEDGGDRSAATVHHPVNPSSTPEPPSSTHSSVNPSLSPVPSDVQPASSTPPDSSTHYPSVSLHPPPFDTNHPNYQAFVSYEAALTQAAKAALPIPQEVRPRLTQLRDRLGLNESEADNIEAWVIARAKAEEDEYQRRCRQYEDALSTVLATQESLGIRPDDLPLLWRQAITKFQTHIPQNVSNDERQRMVAEMQQIAERREMNAEPSAAFDPSVVEERSPDGSESSAEPSVETDHTQSETTNGSTNHSSEPNADASSNQAANHPNTGNGLDQMPSITPVSSPLETFRRLADFPADLKMLEQFLSNQKWMDADRKTFEIMIKLTRREAEKWLDASAINSLQPQDLRGLSRMWAQHSQGKFGFESQREVYQSLMGQHKKPNQRAIAFARQVGWWSKTLQVFKIYSQLDFNINSLDQARKGHFPAYWFWRLPPLESILSGGLGTGLGLCDTDQGVLQELMARLGINEPM
jgi:hypothetical protein